MYGRPSTPRVSTWKPIIARSTPTIAPTVPPTYTPIATPTTSAPAPIFRLTVLRIVRPCSASMAYVRRWLATTVTRRGSMARHETTGRGQQVGLVMAAAAVPGTFTTLAVRADVDGPGDDHRSLDRHPLPAHGHRAGRDRRGRRGHGHGAAVPGHVVRRAAHAGGDAAARPRGDPASGSASSRSSATATTRRPCAGSSVRPAGDRRSPASAPRCWPPRSRRRPWSTARSVPTAASRTSPWPSRWASAIALVLEKIRQRETPPEHYADPAKSSPLLGLAAGAGVVLTLAGLTFGEALARPRARHRRQPGAPRLGDDLAPGSATCVAARRASAVRDPPALEARDARHRGRHVDVRRGHGRDRVGPVDHRRTSRGDPASVRRPGTRWVARVVVTS